ncbi:MAG: hypothetical protein WA802_05155 [Terracidiphilus sp.]
MRIAVTTGLLASLFSLLPAAAATCPGTVVAQDAFTSPLPAWDTTPTPQSKIVIQGGKAETSLLQPGFVRLEEYWGARYGDANACITVSSLATDKAEGQVEGLVFWAADYNLYDVFLINPANGQFEVGQKLTTGQWSFPVAWTASPALAQGMGKANALRVQTKGNTATLFINDQQVGSFTGTPPAGGGQVGFYSESVNTATSTETFDFTNFAVAATQSATPLPASAACPGNVIFQDQFPNGDTFLNIQTGTQAQVMAQDGKGEIILSQGGYGQAVQYGGNQFGDANICATFNTLAADKSENQMAGLEFWATDYNNHYMFLINPTTGVFQFAQKTAGNWVFVVNSTPSTAMLQGMGKTNTLRVQTKGNSAWLYINNQLVDTLTGSAPAGGGVVGIYAQSDSSLSAKETWQFSNLTVSVQ